MELPHFPWLVNWTTQFHNANFASRPNASLWKLGHAPGLVYVKMIRVQNTIGCQAVQGQKGLNPLWFGNLLFSGFLYSLLLSISSFLHLSEIPFSLTSSYFFFTANWPRGWIPANAPQKGPGTAALIGAFACFLAGADSWKAKSSRTTKAKTHIFPLIGQFRRLICPKAMLFFLNRGRRRFPVVFTQEQTWVPTGCKKPRKRQNGV